jgi:hypothetical protein
MVRNFYYQFDKITFNSTYKKQGACFLYNNKTHYKQQSLPYVWEALLFIY